jgi:hypothetical protein
MDSNQKTPPGFMTAQGRQAAAAYLKQEIAAYRGNPFIEALPPIKTEDQAIEDLGRFPPYDPAERKMPAHLRLHAIQNSLQCFVALPVHIDLEQRFSRMIRGGYQNRNPVAPSHLRALNEQCKDLACSTSVIQNSAHAVPLGFTIIGFPGVGKSTSVESVLSLYPQVIYHSRYARSDFQVAQVVWLKLECPFDGSPKGLCMNFFQALDLLLDTNYKRNYAEGRRTTDELLPNMARVGGIHGLGVLVIDEINRLSGIKSDGALKLLSFFVQLTNSMGIPVVLVGTYKAKQVLSGEFHQIRRGTGQGDLVWDRMEEGEWVEKDHRRKKRPKQSPGVWQLLIESLWTYQYTRKVCPLTKELAHVLYEETQGITDFAAKIYMLAQIRAIVTAPRPDDEVITEDIIRSVARDSLKQAQPVLSALRSGNTEYLSQVPDVNPIPIDKFVQQALRDLKTRPSSPTEQPPSKEAKPTPYGELPNKRPAPSKGLKSKSKKRKEDPAFEEDDLRAAFSKAASTKTSVFDALQQAGHIGEASEFLEESETSK